ncbi:hypothetical protein TanjilG_30437 [Lupinus angustifolius]|uniref:high mobility group B protein 15-like n=1 Tax=Lupinus angustifolius TaxID=3871 RepID=UPI00090DECB8|nr:PREDICTED: high mobility group B protein 15-like [Lupinus angustifolius]OIV91215.1 hypothetical protein TanjilG_30437 [Lupinus angustifolius]
MATTASGASKSLLPMEEAVPASSYRAYPIPLAKYEEVVENPNTFMFTLEKLHAEMGTKFMIPIIGGRELNLHHLFVQVTCRGGLEKVIKDRKWKEVNATFNFPSTATNASFMLRKYYTSLIFHYEQVYYFKSLGWAPPPTSDALPSQPTMPSPAPQMQSPQIQSSSNVAELPEAMAASSASSAAIGVIEGKFELGYLVTVTIGSEKLKGILYHPPENSTFSAPHPIVLINNDNVSSPSGVRRRQRRKKSEIKRKDPAHPKPNRSGYNFFFGEQRARLKSLNQVKDKDISRVIGDLWNKLNEPERAVYQERAAKDKERYKTEMEDYHKKLKPDQVISDAEPSQQGLPEHDTDMVDAVADANSFQTPEESSSDEGEHEDGKTNENDFDMDASQSHDKGGSSCSGSEK